MAKQTETTRDIDAEFFIEDPADHQIKHNHLLAIAVDYYEDDDIANLNNCTNDIEGNAKREGLIQLLTTHYFFNKENIRFLRSRNFYGDKNRKELNKQQLEKFAVAEKGEQGYAFVGEADHRTIIAQLKELAKTITPEDNLIICYSGHGIYDQDFDEGYWIPTDAMLKDNASYIENGTIRTALNAIKSHHTVLFSDSCYSGTLFATGQTRALEVPRVYQHPSRWGITAGRKEPVSDGALGENSPFARELLKILARRQEVWISDMISEIIKNIEDKNDKQTPVGEALSFIRGHKNGQFVFLPKLAEEIDYWRIAWKENTRKGYFAFLARYPEGEYEEAALEALNVFAMNKTPGFSEAALNTFDFLAETIDGQAKAYLSNFLKGATQAVLSPTALDMFREALVHFPNEAKNQLKSFILLGERLTRLQAMETAYSSLSGGAAIRKAFFQERLFKGSKANPYCGFEPYRETDSEVFFGRKVVIQELLDKFKKTRLIVISAPPYSGKTSLVRAGLYPMLKMQEGYELLELPAGLARSSYQHYSRILPRISPEMKQLVLIDPFEDLFAENVDGEESEQYQRALLELYQDDQYSSLKIVICMGAGYEGRLRSSTIGQALLANSSEETFLYRLPNLTKEELREVILGPMWSRFFDYDSEALVRQILEEVQNMPNALALLSFALHRLYSMMDGKRPIIKLQDYQEEIGSVQEVLKKVAEEKISESVAREDEPLLRKIFLRMVEPIGGGNYGSRRAWIEEVSHPNDEYHDIGQSLFRDLGEHEEIFNVIRDEGKVVGLQPKELLIASWPRYRQWIEDFGTENLNLQRDLRQAAHKKREALSTRAIAGGYSNYWDNNPKLPRVLHHVLTTGTELLLREEENELKQSIDELQQELSGDQRRRFEALMTSWKSDGKPEFLDEFINTGVSGPLLEIFLHHSPHWLNRTEAEFIQESWEKRSGDITRLYEERNEAVAAREVAEAATKEAEERQQEVARLLNRSAIQSQAFKKKYQEETRKDLIFMQQGFRPDLYLVLIGINEYSPPVRSLKGAVNDTRMMAEAFQVQEGKLYQKVHSTLLNDASATKTNILKAIEGVKAKAGPLDYVVVFISGHGAECNLGSPELGIDGKDGAFLPHDYDPKLRPGSKSNPGEAIISKDNETALFGRELCPLLMEFSAKVILILDITGGGYFLGTLLEAGRSGALDKLTHNVFGLSGCGPGEVPFEDLHGGYFSHALKESFSSAAADLDGNGVVYLDELLLYTSKMVKKRQYKQNVFAVFPATISNIPLIQLTDQFALPKKEIAFSGHIEEERVIESILAELLETDEKLTWAERESEIYQLFQDKNYDGVIDLLLPEIILD